MNGLEKIINEINTNSEIHADGIIFEAQKKADDIKSENREKAKKEVDMLLEKAELEVKRINDNALSSSDAAYKKIILQAKSDILKQWILKSKEYIYALDTNEYFDFIKAIIIKHHHVGEGKLLLPQNDLERVPNDFLNNINDELIKSGAKISTIERGNIKNGCVLDYGDISENCTIDALLEEKSDEIKDTLFKFFK